MVRERELQDLSSPRIYVYTHVMTEKKVWLHFGDMFIKLPTADAKSYIENGEP